MNRFVDADFFKIFDFEFLSGSTNVLNDLSNLVLTETMAKNLFGTADVLGKQVELNLDGTWKIILKIPV